MSKDKLPASTAELRQHLLASSTNDSNHMSVIGGGYSVRDIPLDSVPGKVIAVNDSACWAPRVDYVVSMDRLWTEWRWEDLKAKNYPTWIRQSAMKNVWHQGGEEWAKRGGLVAFGNLLHPTSFSDDRAHLHGTNSGACALNLAYQLRPSHLWVFGFDLSRGPKGEPYWYPPYPWRPDGGTKPGHYRDWAKQMEQMVKWLQAAHIHVTLVTNSNWAKGMPFVTTEQYRRSRP